MASGSKESSVFTGNPMGDGKSSGVKDSSMPGGTIKSSFPQDNVHGVKLPDTTGCKMGGSATNLGHSLSGASAVQRSKGKPESSGI